jgi:hypothetical protein
MVKTESYACPRPRGNLIAVISLFPLYSKYDVRVLPENVVLANHWFLHPAREEFRQDMKI